MIRDISETAIWAAIYRVRETERPKALFRDPFARRLTGERGEQIAAAMKSQDKHEWACSRSCPILPEPSGPQGTARGPASVCSRKSAPIED